MPVNPNRKVFFVHGTAVKEDENRWIQNPLTKSILLKIAGSDISDDGFHWKAPLTNSVTTREVAAKELQTYIKTNSVGFDEIVIVGHSHGGNVAIQASDYFFFPKRYL